MTWDSCVVVLNSDSTGHFYTGDIVTGTVVLEFKHKHKIEYINFEIIGHSKAQWTRPMPTMPHIKFYSEKKKLLYVNIGIFGELNGNTIRPGIYHYPFHFALPNDLPSSFESSIAKVNYCIKIESKSICKQKKIVPFVVMGNINLNHREEFLSPSFHELHKAFWNSGKISLCIKTYKGFASKQVVPFEIMINNEKRVNISKINVLLIQKLTYNVPSGYANEEKKMCKRELKKINNNVNETCSFSMEMPDLIPSSINLINPTIDISYVFRVEVNFLFHFTAYEDIPVTVASVPVIHHEFEHRK